MIQLLIIWQSHPSTPPQPRGEFSKIQMIPIFPSPAFSYSPKFPHRLQRIPTILSSHPHISHFLYCTESYTQEHKDNAVEPMSLCALNQTHSSDSLSLFKHSILPTKIEQTSPECSLPQPSTTANILLNLVAPHHKSH